MPSETRLNIKVKLLKDNATVPAKAHKGDAGWDLCSAEAIELMPGETRLVNTGIAIEIPHGWYAQVKSRSGLGSRGIVVTAGVIDSSYRGEIKVVLINSAPEGSKSSFTFNPGDKIAQMVFLPVPEVTFEVAESLGDTQRGEGGFGSTGNKGR